MKPAAVFALVLGAAACDESHSDGYLELTCPPGPITVGQTLHITAGVDPWEFGDSLEWTQLSEGGELTMPAEPPPWSGGHRELDVVATTPGRTTIAMRWTDDETTPPIFPRDAVTTCTYDIQGYEPPPPPPPPPPPGDFTVAVRRSGRVLSEPAGINCVQGNFDPEVVTTCTATFTTGVNLNADPDETFGFTVASWYGCDLTDGAFCRVNAPSGRRVEVCFHDGTAEGRAICDSHAPQ